MMRPQIHTPLPGPKAQALLARDRAVISNSNSHPLPLVPESGEGAWLTDVDGNVFLDMMAGIAVNTTGHAHPAIVAAVTEQSKKIIHTCSTLFPHEPLPTLAERLVKRLGGGYRCFFGNSGTEGIEAALKLARYTTHRPYFLAFAGSFHGRSAGSVSLTASSSKYRKGFGPMAYPVTHVPYPNPYRPALGASADSIGDAVLEHIRTLFKTSLPPEDVAAVVFEPIQGEGGYIVPPKGFFKALQSLMSEYGILMIADEVQTGAGRTGKFFAFEHEDMATPDIVVMAKGLASGYPLSATLFKEKLNTWPAGAHGTTFGGHAVSAAAAMVTLDLLDGGLVANAASVGGYLIERMKEVAAEFPRLGDVRGRGMMIGLEFITDPASRGEDEALRDRVMKTAYEAGVLTLSAGANALRLAPPLILDKAQADIAVRTLADVIGRATA
ncbi:MAG: acetyl ornithine aminotransferase family protein [Thermoflexales bacterium]|nr:acetyl ornithine aminotransferase family protein [Thermoflexales bacterium]